MCLFQGSTLIKNNIEQNKRHENNYQCAQDKKI